MKRTFTFRVDAELWDKFSELAEINSRSANSQLEFLVKQWVTAYEREYGEILLDSDK